MGFKYVCSSAFGDVEFRVKIMQYFKIHDCHLPWQRIKLCSVHELISEEGLEWV